MAREEETAPAKPRKVFEEKPKFGTVATKIMQKGEEGLFGDDGLDEKAKAAEANKPKDWDQHLQYGKPKKRPEGGAAAEKKKEKKPKSIKSMIQKSLKSVKINAS